MNDILSAVLKASLLILVFAVITALAMLVAGVVIEIRRRNQEGQREVERIVAAAYAEALRSAADDALTMYDPPADECITWSEWLRARAAYRTEERR